MVLLGVILFLLTFNVLRDLFRASTGAGVLEEGGSDGRSRGACVSPLPADLSQRATFMVAQAAPVLDPCHLGRGVGTVVFGSSTAVPAETQHLVGETHLGSRELLVGTGFPVAWAASRTVLMDKPSSLKGMYASAWYVVDEMHSWLPAAQGAGAAGAGVWGGPGTNGAAGAQGTTTGGG
eukprot:scaffold210763_cov69-Attheya_sp.AAC.3